MPWYKEGVKVFGVLTDNSLAGLESGELVDGGPRSRQDEQEERGEGAVDEEGHVEVEEGLDRVWCGRHRTKDQGEGADPEDGGKTEDWKVSRHQHPPPPKGLSCVSRGVAAS